MLKQKKREAATKRIDMASARKRTLIQLGMTDNKEYYEMYDKVQRGEITQEDWVDYCMKLLFEIMEDNKDVFIRLKNRG